jgi:hypothetical protein
MGMSVSVGRGVSVSVGTGVFVGSGVADFVTVGISIFVGSGEGVAELVGLGNKPPPPLTRVRRSKNGGTVLVGVTEPAGVTVLPVTNIPNSVVGLGWFPNRKNGTRVGVKKRFANACWVRIRSSGVGVGDNRGTNTTSEYGSRPPATR